jgi:uncharacterized membrane protein YhaH (DUF805 family)
MQEFVNNYLSVLKRYVDFQGRARRREYWMFFLANVIVSVLFLLIGSMIMNSSEVTVPNMIYSLAVLLPSLAAAARRLHDTGKSAWYLFIGLVPIVGPILIIVFLATEGTKGDNAYGPNPKG